MTNDDHESLVVEQFGPQAQAYVRSLTHSQGEDLKQLADIAAARPGARVLDLGCGGGHASFAMAPYVKNVVAYDLSQSMLDAVAAEATRRDLPNVSTVRGPVEKLPFGPSSFDVVVSRLSAHHWSDLGAALAEARRVIAPDGHAVLVDSISPGTPKLDTFLQGFELFRDPSHVRSYSEAEWRAALAAAGFTVTNVTHRRLRNAFDPWIERMRTPKVQADAIRAVQRRMPDEVTRHFAIEADGSFVLDLAMIEAHPTR